MFDDMIFCEFAIFELQEMETAVFSEGKVIWSAEDFDHAISVPRRIFKKSSHSTEYRVGEALTNLYIGMGRYLRGEKLSAAKFVQQYALDHVIALSKELEAEQLAMVDQFSIERRFEQRFPAMTKKLPLMMQGYDKTPQSALAILQVLQQLTNIPATFEQQIIERIQIALQQTPSNC